jgi:CRP/FNR family transcriptional regulator, anaerobic regulatory protein
MNNTTSQDWLGRFPALAAARDPELQRLVAAAPLLQVPAGVTVFHAGDACERYLMVLEGSVRVQKLAENGREIVLYRVAAGETCVLTTSCLLAGERYPAEGVTESPVTAAALPLARFQEALARSETFRRFVFTSFGERMAELMTLVEAIAFGRLDSRLAQRLLALGQSTARVPITHQQLAAELGSAREVISRLLKEFERLGCIALERGEIAILDPVALARLANP